MFVYFLNAIHYCLWIGDIKISNHLQKIVFSILSPIPKLFFTREYREKFYARQATALREYQNSMFNKNNGTHIIEANRFFSFIYCGYPSIISFTITGFFIPRFLHNPLVFISIYGIVEILCYIPAYKAVFSHNRYLEYFSKFEKEDAAWHKKWKRRTIAFCFGSMLSFILGVASAFAVAIALS